MYLSSVYLLSSEMTKLSEKSQKVHVSYFWPFLSPMFCCIILKNLTILAEFQDEGKYTVSYTPKKVGTYKVTILHNNIPFIKDIASQVKKSEGPKEEPQTDFRNLLKKGNSKTPEPKKDDKKDDGQTDFRNLLKKREGENKPKTGFVFKFAIFLFTFFRRRRKG